MSSPSSPWWIEDLEDVCLRFQTDLSCLIDGEIEEERQVGHNPRDGGFADAPNFVHVEPAGVGLIDHVGQQEPIGNDGPSRGQRRANHLFHQLSPGGHVKEHLAAAVDVQVVPVQEQAADRLAQRRASRIAASDNLAALLPQPLDEQGDLS